MITESMMYWITRCDSICTVLLVFGVIFLIASGFVLNAVTGSVNISQKSETVLMTLAPVLFFASILMWIAFALVPNTREMCAIKVVPMLANNKDVQNIAVEVKDLALDWIRSQKRDLEKKDSK